MVAPREARRPARGLRALSPRPNLARPAPRPLAVVGLDGPIDQLARPAAKRKTWSCGAWCARPR